MGGETKGGGGSFPLPLLCNPLISGRGLEANTATRVADHGTPVGDQSSPHAGRGLDFTWISEGRGLELEQDVLCPV